MDQELSIQVKISAGEDTGFLVLDKNSSFFYPRVGKNAFLIIWQSDAKMVRKPMKLEDIMTRRVVTVDMDDTLAVIQEIFENAQFHHVLVLAGDYRAVGVISDRDLLKALSPFINTVSEQDRDQATLNKKAHQIMSRSLIFASPETSVEEAAKLLVDNSISCLPILARDKSILGIVTWKDILKSCV